MISNKHGFTLIELLSVIAVVAVLFAIIVPVIGAVRERAYIADSITSLRSLGSNLHLYRMDNRGRFPAPLWTNQGPHIVVNQNEASFFSGSIVTALRDMYGMSEAPRGTFVEAFAPKGWIDWYLSDASAQRPAFPACYRVRSFFDISGLGRLYPFGYPSAVNGETDPPEQGNYLQLIDRANASDEWIIQEYFSNDGVAGPPLDPDRGRVNLYLDNSVALVK